MIYNILIIGLIISICLVSARMVKGPTIWDRVLTINVISTKVIIIILILAIINEELYYVDIAIAYALLGFISTVFLARYIERRKDL